MKKTLVIYNQISGRNRRFKVNHFVKKYLTRKRFVLTFKNYENFLADSKLAQEWNYDLVIIVGGDGTIRQVASFLLSNDIKTPLAIVPTGSANVLAHGLGIPLNLKQAIRLIPRSKPFAIDVGRINGSYYFISAFTIGYIADRILAAGRRLKDHFGFIGYLMSFFFNRHLPHHTFRFSVDDQQYVYQGNTLFIVNTAKLYGFTTKRSVVLDDRKMELTIATNSNFWSFFLATYYYYFHKQPPRHLIISEGSRFTIATDGLLHPQIDGDYLELPSETRELIIEVLHKKLLVLKP